MLHSLELFHYRNIDSLRIEFDKGLNALVGNNGQGKTNILEAVYYLSLLRSFRTSQVNDLKQWKSPVFRLHGVCKHENLPDTELDVVYGTERKLSVNGNHVYRTSEYINRFVCITFIPQDMELIRGGDAQRRRFMDIAISQVSSAYLKNLQAYHEALKSRNALLKECERYGKNVVTAYDTVLVKKGVLLELERREFVRKINVALEETSKILLKDTQRTLSVKYLSGIGNLLQASDDDEETLHERFMATLDKNFQRDCRDGFTHSGPHRAEFTCLLDNASLLHFGSEGECRLASLAVRFACLDSIKNEIKPENITLIVDDVIGELDESRQENFFELLKDAGQIIMAGTCLPKSLRQQPKVMHVKGGKIDAM